MKSVVGFTGRAIPNANWVLAPKKRWKDIPVRGSMNAEVTWALVNRKVIRRLRIVTGENWSMMAMATVRSELAALLGPGKESQYGCYTETALGLKTLYVRWLNPLRSASFNP